MQSLTRTLTLVSSLFLPLLYLYPNIIDEYWSGGIDHSFLSAEAYPLVPVHIAKEDAWQVVSGRNGKVVVLKGEGKRSTIGDPRLCLLKGEVFAPGIVQVTESSVTPRKPSRGFSSFDTGYYTQSYRAPRTGISLKLMPSESYDEVVLGMLFFDGAGAHELYMQSLGSLLAREERQVSFDIPVAFDTSNNSVGYTVLLFCPEGEIVTDGRRQMTPFLNGLFEDLYSELVFAYQERNHSQSRPVSLVQKYPLLMEVDGSSLAQRATVYFTLTVDKRGLVEGVAASRELSDEIYSACEQSFREWLFMPKLENGFPLPSQVRVPVSFPAE